MIYLELYTNGNMFDCIKNSTDVGLHISFTKSRKRIRNKFAKTLERQTKSLSFWLYKCSENVISNDLINKSYIYCKAAHHNKILKDWIELT